jgi:predicted permease
MFDCWQDIKYSARVFRASPGLFIAVVATLAVAVGGNATVLSWLEGVVFHPMAGVAAQDRIVAVAGIRQPGDRCCGFSYPDYVDYRDHATTLDGIVAGELMAPNVSGEGKAERAVGQVVTGNYFDVLGVKAQLGRTFLPEDDRTAMSHPVIVISDGFWRRRFGADPAAVGRTVLLNGFPFTIIGVTPPRFIGTFVGYSLDLWAPTAMEQALFPGGDRLSDRSNAWLEGYARLKAGVSRERAQAELDLISQRIQTQFPETHRGFTLKVFPLWRTPFGGLPLVAPLLTISMVVVGVVLLIGCANVASLLLTRAVRRRHEMAIRASLGATRSRLVRQTLTESCLLALAGGAVGLFVPLYFQDALPYFFPASSVRITMQGQLDARVLGATAFIALGTGLVFGLWPAFHGSAADAVSAVKENSTTSSMGRVGASACATFLVIQIAMTVVLLVGAGLFLQTLWRAARADLGVDRDHVMIASFDLFPARYNDITGRAFLRRFMERISQLPGVTSVSLATRLPFSVRGPATVEIAVPGYGLRRDETPFAEYSLVGPNYAQTLGVPLLRGRDFSDHDTEQTSRVAVINETMARRYWPGEDAVGRQFSILGASATVVGIAKDEHYHSLTEDPRPYAYLPILQVYESQLSLIVRAAGNPSDLMRPVQDAAARLNPQLALYTMMPMDAYLGFAVFGQRTASVLLATFGTLALLLASLGLYSAVAYGVATRAREIGIRLALGGSAGDVLGLLMRHGFVVSVTGVAIGLVGATALARSVASQMYGVSPSDPGTYLVSALMVLLTASTATFIPALRASRADVTATLRRL